MPPELSKFPLSKQIAKFPLSQVDHVIIDTLSVTIHSYKILYGNITNLSIRVLRSVTYQCHFSHLLSFKVSKGILLCSSFKSKVSSHKQIIMKLYCNLVFIVKLAIHLPRKSINNLHSHDLSKLS